MHKGGEDMTTIQEFNQIDGRISSLYHAAALKMGLSDSEFRILYTLAVNEPGYLQSALREATGMGRSTVNSALKKLEREGILTLSPGSGRHTCVSLTAQGHRLAERTVGRLIRLEDRIYAGWTAEEQALLLRLNRDFTEKLEAIEGEETVTALRLAGGGLLPADGLFVALGVAGSAALARKLGAPVENGRIVVDEKMQTGIPGLFAAGDCTGGMLQVCKAVYEGALAATEAIKQIRGKK